MTLNPAIDRTLSVDRLAFEDRSYINSSHDSAGGRGINASNVIHAFGGETLAILVSGGASGRRLEQQLRTYGFKFIAVPIQNRIRTNITVTDKQGLTVNLNEAGPKVTRAELGRVEKVVRDSLDHAQWLMVCGSMPPGVPSSFYAKVIAMARGRKVKTLLHAGGDALRDGIQEQPTVVTPNQQEAEHLLGRSLLTRTHYLEAAAEIRAMGPESVVMSLGSHGAVAAFPEGLVEAVAPRVDAVCPIGSGDALAAAYCWSMRRKSDRADALRWGVAAGTASACVPGMSFASLPQTEQTYKQVELRRVE